MNRPWARAGGGPAVAWLALAACACAATPAGGAKGPARPGLVTKGDLVQVLTLNGSLTARKAERYTAPRQAGWRQTLKWLIDEGTTVKPGDAVARLDASSLTADIQQQEVDLQDKRQQKALKEIEGRRAALEVELRVKRAEVALAKARLDAAVPEEVSGKKTRQERQIDLGRAERELAQAKEAQKARQATLEDELQKLDIEIGAAEKNLARNREALDAMTIRATVAGPVVYEEHYWYDRKIQVGDTVSATQPLLTIPEVASMEVTAWTNETDAALLAEGQPVELRLDAFPERLLRGKVRRVSPAADARPSWGDSHYFRVNVALDEPDAGIMKPGMSVQCRVRVGEIKDALLVPLDALTLANGRYFVKPVGEDRLEVTPLGHDAFFAAVKPVAGLAPGDRLGVAGALGP